MYLSPSVNSKQSPYDVTRWLWYLEMCVLWERSVTFPSAPASWPPVAGCCSTPPPTAWPQESLQRPQAVPPAHQYCPARAPAMFQAQCGHQTHQEPRCGHWTQTSTPTKQPLCPQFPRRRLCRTPLLRTHNHQVSRHGPHTGGIKWSYYYY